MRNLILATSIATALALSPVAWSQKQPVTATATSADARAIRTIHEHWAGLILAKNAAAIERLYADDAVLMAPGEQAVVGSTEIGTRWARQLGLEGFKFGLRPQQLRVSTSGDLAFERGAYDFVARLVQGPITDTGKYVLVWQKVGGKWKE